MELNVRFVEVSAPEVPEEPEAREASEEGAWDGAQWGERGAEDGLCDENGKGEEGSQR